MWTQGLLLGAAMAIATGAPAVAATLTTLVNFNFSNGAGPSAELLMGADGNLYGTTGSGGSGSYGTVFRLNPETGSLTTLASFNSANGAFPTTPLIADSVGNLYGTTASGGSSFFGVVFKLDPASQTLTELFSFGNPVIGRFPRGGLVASADGGLYGTTSEGGGVFRLDPATSSFAVLASFNTEQPWAGLRPDARGDLYGTTLFGGAQGYGTVFRLDPKTGTLTTPVTFNFANGRYPEAGLITDAAGNLYGAASSGGPLGGGNLFKLDPAGTLTTLANLEYATGVGVVGDLLADAAGNLYGTARAGGASNFGTVFKLDPAGTLTTLANFNLANGGEPRGGLVADDKGTLYGTTSRGGGDPDACNGLGCGTVFKLTDTGFVPWTVTRDPSFGAAGALTSRNANATVVDFAGGLPLPVVGTPVGVIVDSGSIENVRRAPAGVSGDYLSIGFGEIVFDFGEAIAYFGFYAGSPDEYNFIEFFAGSGESGVLGAAVDVPGFGTVITGTELANVFGAPLYGNEYYNFSFSLLQDVQFVRLSSTNTAFEIGEMAWELFGGNIVAAQAQVPAPGAAWLMLGGLGLLGARRR